MLKFIQISRSNCIHLLWIWSLSRTHNIFKLRCDPSFCISLLGKMHILVKFRWRWSFDRSHLPANVTVVQLSNGVFQTMYYPNKHMADVSLLNSIYDIPNAIYLSAMIFISQVPSNWYVNGYWKYVIMFERIAGWLLMALFIVVLTKKLIR